MSRIVKIAEQLLKKPEVVSYRNLRRILLFLGFEEFKTKGSHVKFKHEILGRNIIIPVHNNECKAFYKRLVAKELKDQLDKLLLNK